MNVLIVNYEYPPIGAGSATAARALAAGLKNSGNTVVVLTSAFGPLRGKADEDGVVVVRVPAGRRRADRCSMAGMGLYIASAALHLPTVVRQFCIDRIVVFFSLPCGPLALFARMRYGIPYVVSLRGSDVPGSERSLMWVHALLAPVRRCVLRRSAAVVANSEGLRALSEQHDPVRVTVVANGVDTEFFCPPADQAQRSNGAFRILFVGRLQAQKNLRVLLRAVRAIGVRPSGPQAELHLVGDGPLRDDLHRYARELGIDGVTSWHGWVEKEKIRELYRSAHCLVNPSLGEGMPNAVLEAMACGLPVVASNVAGNCDLVTDHETGLLFDPRDEAGLAGSLRALMDSPETGTSMGRTGRARAVATFSWQSCVSRYMHLLDGGSTSPAASPNVTPRDSGHVPRMTTGNGSAGTVARRG